MLTGFYVLKRGGGTKYTPSFPRRGLAATLQIQVLDLVASPTGLVASIEHRNLEDMSCSLAASFSPINSVSIATLSVSPLKEQMRLAFAPNATHAWEGSCVLCLSLPEAVAAPLRARGGSGRRSNLRRRPLWSAALLGSERHARWPAIDELLTLAEQNL